MANQGLSAGYVPATRQVDIPGGDGFAVRGLSPADIAAIYLDHAGDLGLWFERLVAGGASDTDSAAPLISGLISGAPTIAAALIGAAAGTEPEAVPSLMRLPIGVQFEALTKIGDLTFTSEMPPKKVFEIVIEMVRPTLAIPTPAET